jgi:molecular chaperone GrpE
MTGPTSEPAGPVFGRPDHPVDDRRRSDEVSGDGRRVDPGRVTDSAPDRSAGPDLPGGPGGPEADTAAADAAAEEVEADLDMLTLVVRERDEYLDALRRLQADFENYKKRVARQQTDYVERAAERLVEKLLPVLDTADLALSHGGGDAVTQLRSALGDALAREGLERIEPVDQPFDPNVADAVAHEPGDGDGHGMTVAEVLRAGYRWKGRVLRPAMVKVRG